MIWRNLVLLGERDDDDMSGANGADALDGSSGNERLTGDNGNDARGPRTLRPFDRLRTSGLRMAVRQEQGPAPRETM